MTDTVEQKKSRLEQLAKRKAEIEAALKAEKERIKRLERKAKTTENAKARKALTRTKIEYGGLCEIAGLLDTDKGAVLGVLLWAADKFKTDTATFDNLKKKGDTVLAQREAGRKKAVQPVEAHLQ